MAYDKVLADRIRRLLGARRGIREMEQFGGVGFLVKGNMALGVIGSDLLVRVGPDSYEDALKTPHTKAFAMTGRPMRGWVLVRPAGTKHPAGLKKWVEQGLDFARRLPAK